MLTAVRSTTVRHLNANRTTLFRFPYAARFCDNSRKAKRRAAATTGVVDDFLNKEVTGVTDRLYAYILEHTPEPEALMELRKETFGMSSARMQISPDQGRFLAFLAEVSGAKKAIEIGVFTGYSSLAVAMALPEDGKLVAIDRDEGPIETARKYWEKAGVSHKIVERIGNGVEELERVLEEEGPNSFDFGFIDADKRGYDGYYELLLKLIKPNGIIALDNMLWYGKVADNEAMDKTTIALRELNEKAANDPRVSFSLIPIGDGLALCRKR